AGMFSVVALSLDGLRERHNAIRGSSKSFEQVRAAAAVLRACSQRFGIIHTLCSESLDEVEEIAELASEWGASLLQLHPLEPTATNLSRFRMVPLSAEERLDAYLLATIVADRFPHMYIQLDLVHREIARRLPHAIHGAPLKEPMAPRELVLEETGQLVPLTYGLGRAFAVTDVHGIPLADAWASYLESRWGTLRGALRRACVAVARGVHGEVVAWHEIVRQYAGRVAADERAVRFDHVAA
ncbi:MAG TPA: hypothetical protein VLW55_10435, partial [Burkholderiaceae bacterium]|nr:hypothetical protein [Burkholderiaceae bacterium]